LQKRTSWRLGEREVGEETEEAFRQLHPTGKTVITGSRAHARGSMCEEKLVTLQLSMWVTDCLSSSLMMLKSTFALAAAAQYPDSRMDHHSAVEGSELLCPLFVAGNMGSFS